MDRTLQEIWKRIRQQLSQQAPEVFQRLQSGATDEQVHQAEAILQVTFPEEVKELYRIHNGCARVTSPSVWPLGEVSVVDTSEKFLDFWEFHSLESLCEEQERQESETGITEWHNFVSEIYRERQEGIIQHFPMAVFYPCHWHPQWLPFMTSQQGCYFIDLIPGPKGNVGQILFLPPSRTGEGIAHVVAHSLSDFLLHVANELVAGKYCFDDSIGMFVSEEGWLFARKAFQVEDLWRARKEYTGRDIPYPDTPTYALLKGGR